MIQMEVICFSFLCLRVSGNIRIEAVKFLVNFFFLFYIST